MGVLLAGLVLLCAAWWLQGALLLRNHLNLVRLADLPVVERDAWPSVAIIAPARNEAETIEQAVRSRLRSDYPELTLVLVDDRSDDETGTIADRLAEDRRVEAIHVTELRPDWLGKVHALDHGVRSSDSTWVLFSDADVHFEAGLGDVLRRVVHYAESRELDLVAAMPTIAPAGPLMAGLHALFLRVMLAMFDPVRIANPNRRFAAGVGAFTLVRRAALDASPGLEAIRLEVADDLQLGMMLKASGARCAGINGASVTHVDLYPGAADFVTGAEKNAWGVLAGFSLARGLVSVALFVAFELAPWLLIAVAPSALGRAFAVATAGVAIGTSMLALVMNGRRPWGGLVYPVGALLFGWAMLRGTLLGWWHRGLRWRGTHYSNATFRRFARAKRYTRPS